MFLNRLAVEQQEELLRTQIRNLPDEVRARIFQQSTRRLKDPDTFAALNYGLMVGLHHLYLGKYLRAIIEWLIFVIGLVMIFSQAALGLGLFLVIAMTLFELYELFRSQIIVQDHNNQLTEKIIAEVTGQVNVLERRQKSQSDVIQ